MNDPRVVGAAFYTTKVIPDSYQNIGTPRDIITLDDDSMWYVDSQNFRIIKVNSSGQILRTVGREGNGEGEFEAMPTSITKDNDGNLYVSTLHKIYKFDFNGGYLASWGTFGGGVGEISEPRAIHYSAHGDFLVLSNSSNNRVSIFSKSGSLVREFGSLGTGDGQFDAPHGLTTDTNGNIYVVDTNNQRVQVFSEIGDFMFKFGSGDVGDYQFVFPKDVALLSSGDILVTSQNAPLVKKFNSAGVYETQWGTSGTASDQFLNPEYLTIANDDSVWVTDWNQKRIQHFSNAGAYIGKLGNSGQNAGFFTNPLSSDYDSLGNLYVLDSTGRVQKFGTDGSYLSTLIASGVVGDSAYHLKIQPITNNILVSCDVSVKVFDPSGTLISSIGTQGINGGAAGDGDFNQARGMVFDTLGYLYVADLFNNRVQKFDLTHLSDVDFATTYSGGYITKWNTMTYVEHLAIDDADYIYVAPNDSVEENLFTIPVNKYNTSGVLQSTILDEYGVEASQYYQIGGLVVGDDGKIYVADKYFNRIQVYDSAGLYLESIASSGSGLDQYDSMLDPKINPVDGSLTVVDSRNHRIQILTTGVKIHNLISSADVINVDDSHSLVSSTVNPSVPEASSINAEMYFGDYIVSDFVVDLSSDRNWISVNAIVLPNESKSLVVDLNPTDAPGVSATHSLFVVKQNGQTGVRVCTTATSIADVTDGCTGYNLAQGDPNLSVVSVGAVSYWKIDGLTGTGAYSVTDTSPTPSPSSNPSSGNSNGGGSSGSSNNNQGESCTAGSINEKVDLFQINTTTSTATLYFAPLPTTNHYFISFSTKPWAEEYGAEVELAREGVQKFTVNLLKPNTQYYFKVRGREGCKVGQWSGIVRAVTMAKNRRGLGIFYKNSPVSPSTRNATVRNKSVVAPVKNTETIQVDTTPKPTPVAIDPVVSRRCVKFLWWCI